MSSDEPQRRCILSAEHGTRAGLIRLALGPDGQVAPDLQAKAGGRGAWVGVTRAELEAAQKKGRLKGALARAFRTAEFTVPPDLADRIESGLARAALDRLGLENRAGALMLGVDRIADAMPGRARLLLHASDAASDGREQLDRRARAAGVPIVTAPASRQALSAALGRANVVHIAVSGDGPANRICAAFARWRDFTGRINGEPHEATSAAAAAACPEHHAEPPAAEAQRTI